MTGEMTVVGLGKIGLPLAVQIAGKGFRVHGADRNPDVIRLVAQGSPPFPGEPGLAERLRAAVEAGMLVTTSDTARAVAHSDVVIIVVPLVTGAAGRPDYSAVDAATAAVAAGLQRWHPGQLRDHAAGAHHAATARAGAGRRIRPEAWQRLHALPQPGAGIQRDGLRGPAPVPQAGRRDRRGQRQGGGGVLRSPSWTSMSAPTWPARMAYGTSAAPRPPSSPSWPRPPTAMSTSRWPTSSPGSPRRTGINVYEVIEAANSQPYSHLHRPGIAVGGHCIPVYPRLYLAGDPDARLPAVAREVNEAVPAQAVQQLADLTGGLSGLRVAVLGAAYRSGVKETAFSGVFAIVRELALLGAVPLVHDPLYSDSSSASLILSHITLASRVTR